MNSLIRKISLWVVAALCVCFQAQALNVAMNWTTGNFSTNTGWIANDALAYQTNTGGVSETGQNYSDAFSSQWFTDDPYNAGSNVGASSVVFWLQNFTLGSLSSGNNSVLFGGYGLADGIFPGSSSPSIYRSFNSLLTTNSEFVTFSVDFSIISSAVSDPDPSYDWDDSFGFNLLDASGATSLAKFSFNRAAASGTNNLLGVQWIGNGATNTLADIQYGSLYRLTATLSGNTFDLSLGGLSTQTNGVGDVTGYLLVTNQNLVTGGLLSGGGSALDFETVALDWELESGNAASPGSNYMVMNTATVYSQVVPEPATWATGALLLTGVAASVIRRRRQQAA